MSVASSFVTQLKYSVDVSLMKEHLFSSYSLIFPLSFNLLIIAITPTLGAPTTKIIREIGIQIGFVTKMAILSVMVSSKPASRWSCGMNSSDDKAPCRIRSFPSKRLYRSLKCRTGDSHVSANAWLSSSQSFMISCRRRLSANCRPTVSQLLAVCRATVGQPSADIWSTVNRQSADRQPTVGWPSTDSRPTDGQQTANSQPTVFVMLQTFTVILYSTNTKYYFNFLHINKIYRCILC